MEIETYDDPRAFAARVRPLLLENEAENHLLLGIVGVLARAADEVSTPMPGQDGPLLWAVGDGDRCVAVALMTPPFNVVVTRAIPRTVGVLVDGLVERSVPIPGVLAPSEVAATFANHWQQRTGRPMRPGRAQRIYALEGVHDCVPAGGVPPEGTFRPARPDEEPLLEPWASAFHGEVGQPGRPPGKAVEQMIAGGRLFVWECRGRPVSMAAWAGPTDNGVRINAVYTPAEERRRGYASACVAALCRERLRAGKRWCFLFADRANATTNHIYQEIGFRAVCDFDELFLR